jgi:hypothetical protein
MAVRSALTIAFGLLQKNETIETEEKVGTFGKMSKNSKQQTS